MNTELAAIIADIPQTRLSIIGNRLARFDRSNCSQAERIQILYWLIVCRKEDAALEVLHELAKEEMAAELAAQLYVAKLRCHLLEFYPLPENENVLFLPQWVKKFNELAIDIAYATEIQGISLAHNSRKNIILSLDCVCIACKNTIITTIQSDLLPLDSEKNVQWICPHCLAAHSLNKRIIRDRLWDSFSEHFTNLPVDSHGILDDNDATLTLLLANALEPYAPIRFCSFRQDRIGHLCMGGARILEQIGGSEKLTLDFYGFETKFFTANTVLAALWKRFFNSTVAAQQLYWLAHAAGMPHLGPLVQHPNYAESHNGRYTYPLQMNFSEMQQGMRALEAMGIPRGAKIACLFVRDPAYLSTGHPEGTDANNGYRNADIDSYQKACEELAAQGWYVLRMGATVAKPITWVSDHIIDYATHFRTEFMDIWLLLHSDLCMCMGSGPDVLFAMRNRPWLLSNAVDLFYVAMLSPDSLVLPKHVVRTQTQQAVSLQEYLLHEADFESAQKNLSEGNLQYINNTSDEIYDTVCEQLAILEGTLSYSQEDIAMRKKYQKLGSYKHENLGAMRANFSLAFLHAESKNFTV